MNGGSTLRNPEKAPADRRDPFSGRKTKKKCGWVCVCVGVAKHEKGKVVFPKRHRHLVRCPCSRSARQHLRISRDLDAATVHLSFAHRRCVYLFHPAAKYAARMAADMKRYITATTTPSNQYWSRPPGLNSATSPVCFSFFFVSTGTQRKKKQKPRATQTRAKTRKGGVKQRERDKGRSARSCYGMQCVLTASPPNLA